MSAERATHHQRIRHPGDIHHLLLDAEPIERANDIRPKLDAGTDLREFRRLLDLPDSLFNHGPACYDDIIRFNAERGEYGSGDVESKVRALTERVRLPITPHRFERTRPDGTPLEIQGGPMPSGGFVTTYTDIGARKRAEAEGARSAALLRGAIDAIDEAFVLFDPDDRLVFCNEKYRQIYASVAHLMVPGASFAEIVRCGAENGDYSAAVGRVDEWMAERLAAHQACDTSLMQRLRDGRALRIVERKMADGHIVGFQGTASVFTTAPMIDASTKATK